MSSRADTSELDSQHPDVAKDYHSLRTKLASATRQLKKTLVIVWGKPVLGCRVRFRSMAGQGGRATVSMSEKSSRWWPLKVKIEE